MEMDKSRRGMTANNSALGSMDEFGIRSNGVKTRNLPNIQEDFKDQLKKGK